MELNAKIAKGGKQISIHKRGTTFSQLVPLAVAKKAVADGKVHKTNKCMDRLIENDFDVDKTLQYYIDRRKKLAKKSN